MPYRRTPFFLRYIYLFIDTKTWGQVAPGNRQHLLKNTRFDMIDAQCIDYLDLFDYVVRD